MNRNGRRRTNDDGLCQFVDALRACLDMDPLYGPKRDIYDGPSIYRYNKDRRGGTWSYRSL